MSGDPQTKRGVCKNYVLYQIRDGGTLKEIHRMDGSVSEQTAMGIFMDYINDYDMFSKEFTVITVYEPKYVYER